MTSILKVIWDEVGENDEEKQKTLLEMQQECLDIFQRKVDQANRSRSNLHIMLADVHSEIVSLASTLGDNIQMAQVSSCFYITQLVQSSVTVQKKFYGFCS
jgi:protein regulator of cytokinesis 1